MTESPNRDLIVLDTSVILYDSECIRKFSGYDLVVPLIVLDEIDKFRRTDSQIGRHARRFVRDLKKLKGLNGSYSEGLERKGSGELIFIKKLSNPAYLDGIVLNKDKNDDKIIAVCLELKKDCPNRKIYLVTKDIALCVKASTLGIENREYDEDTVVTDVSRLYTGTYKFAVTTDIIDRVHAEGIISINEIDTLGQAVYDNAGVFLYAPENKHSTALAVYRDGSLYTLNKNSRKVRNITPRNREQIYAMDLLLNPEIRLVSLTGFAGTGKTLVSVACALHQIDSGIYDRLIISRPIQPLGKDIGYLPGPQPLDAKVLTPTGWTTMGEVRAGDSVVAHDGTSVKVKEVFYKGIKPVYKVETTEGSNTECCLDHLWHTKTAENRKRKKKGSVKTTKEIMDTIESNLPGKKLNSFNPRYGYIRPNHFLPRNGPIKYNKRDLALHPYILGCILGDGSISNCITVSTKDKEIIDRINSLLYEGGEGCRAVYSGSGINYTFSGEYLNNKPAKSVKIENSDTGETIVYPTIGEALKRININRGTLNSRCKNNLTIDNYTYSFLPCSKRWQNPIKNILHVLGLGGTKAWNKFIPEDYLYTSVEDRIDLLRGLMDTDGSVKKSNGEASFTTTSKILAEGVVELVRSLGGRARLLERNRIGKKSTVNGKDIISRRVSYEFSISLPEGINPFYLERKHRLYKSKSPHEEGIVDISYVGEKEVKCILIDHPDHLYITDDFIVTHNTVEDKFEPWMAPIVDAIEYVYNGDRNKYEQLKDFGQIEIEPLTYIRGRSIPNTIFVLDESQNVTPHEMKTIITRIGTGSKIILTGDIFQIDNNYLDMSSNGLTYAVEKFKFYDIAGHVNFRKGQRSRLASLAAEIL